MSTITVDEMARDPAGWLKRVQAGEALAVVQNGEVVAELTAPADRTRRPRVAGSCAGQFTVPADFDAPLPDAVVDEFYK